MNCCFEFTQKQLNSSFAIKSNYTKKACVKIVRIKFLKRNGYREEEIVFL